MLRCLWATFLNEKLIRSRVIQNDFGVNLRAEVKFCNIFFF